MGSSVIIISDGGTPKQRKGKNAKGNDKAETSTEPLSFVSGHDALSQKRASPQTSPLKTEETITMSIKDNTDSKTPSPETTSTATADDVLSSTPDPIKTSKKASKNLRTRMKEQKQKIQLNLSRIPWGLWFEWAMGLWIILCFVYPGTVGLIPTVPRFLYKTFDPLSGFSWSAN